MLAGLQNVTFEFGARPIVKDATWHIHPNERIGLIGYNGTGKSTLLKLIVGEYQPSKGEMIRSKNTSIGYLHQDLLSFDTNDSILQVAMSAFARVIQLEKEIEELGKKLEEKEDEALLIQYTDKLHEIDTLDGYTIHHRTEEVLQGLGFSNDMLHRPYKEFSGGWRMRVLLAKMILQQPDLLLLDEPTNHLDLPSIEWLEKYLSHYKGSVIIVSHDRYFLDRMVTKIVEVYQQQLHIYNGNYTFFEQEKELRIEMQQRAYENQQDYIRQQERFIERFKAKASKAAQAQSIVKRLDRLDRIEDVQMERPNIKINFSVDKQPGKILCTLTDITKRFGDNTIVEKASAEINRGDKIGLIGANGKGKSTLLRIIAGVEGHEGERKWGHNVDESFYAQHQLEALNMNISILEEMKMCGSQKTEVELRSLLGCFLFGGEEVDKRIKVLSGGEKARVALAKTIVSKANFLMLDEPTNHLDMHSVDLLIEALNKYQGSLILVSHDRYFVAKTANKIWEIDNGEIREFIGTYDEWADWKQRKAAQEKGNGSENKKKPALEEKKSEPVISKEEQAAKNNPINKEAKKELQKIQKRFEQVEKDLAIAQQKKVQLESDLATPAIYGDRNKFVQTEKAYQEVTGSIASLSTEYETLFEKIMDQEG